MARYTDSVCRLCRREGAKLFLKGDRCFTDKCSVSRRSFPPGQHGQGKGRKKTSEYGLQLREKQKARRFYGIAEGQFRGYFERAERQKGIAGENLLRFLERRLDNIVYRLGFAASRAEARMQVRHGHYLVNDRKVNIPSYLVRPGDVVAVREKSKALPRFQEMAGEGGRHMVPAWLSVDAPALRGSVLGVPNRDQIDTPIQEHLIVELYSK